MSEMRYTKEHEWIRLEDKGATCTVGITDYAQSQLGDVVYVELPAVGKEVKKGGEAATVESVKAASEVYAPVSGVVTEVNAALTDNPGLVNQSATGDGWFFRLRTGDTAEFADLMDDAAYQAYVASLS
jgi:glycine cleavage system H protein